MNESSPSLPPNALAAFTSLYPKEKPSWQRRPQTLRLADYEYHTVGIELLDGKVVLCLSRDCPFDEIAPGYLALFVYHLAQLNPDVPVAYIPGYGHPIVATLPFEVPLDAPVEAWTSAIEATLPRLEEALARQYDAADQFKRDDDFRWNSPLPDIEVTPEDLAEIGRLEAETVLGPERLGREELDRQTAELNSKLRSLRVIRPNRNWVRYLRHDNLNGGFFDGVRVEHFTASQLVVTLNAIYDGNTYNTTLVHHACGKGLFARIAARARELILQD
jgi:hypothetical protein